MVLSKLQNQEKLFSQLAGLLYLIIAVVGGFSIGFMPNEIVVADNAAQTFQNLIDHQGLFRFGIAGDIIVLVLEALLTVMLYQLFKSVSTTGIKLATYSRFAMAIIMGMNLINYMIPALILNQPEHLVPFSKEELEAVTLLFFNVHHYGELTWQIFFAIHLFTIGYVVQKSVTTPKKLGALLMIGGVGYAGDCVIQFLFLDSQALSIFFTILLVFAVIAEFWFAFWLLLKGMKTKAIV